MPRTARIRFGSAVCRLASSMSRSSRRTRRAGTFRRSASLSRQSPQLADDRQAAEREPGEPASPLPAFSERRSLPARPANRPARPSARKAARARSAGGAGRRRIASKSATSCRAYSSCRCVSGRRRQSVRVSPLASVLPSNLEDSVPYDAGYSMPISPAATCTSNHSLGRWPVAL